MKHWVPDFYWVKATYVVSARRKEARAKIELERALKRSQKRVARLIKKAAKEGRDSVAVPYENPYGIRYACRNDIISALRAAGYTVNSAHDRWGIIISWRE